MSLLERLNNDMKQAMKNKEKEKLPLFGWLKLHCKMKRLSLATRVVRRGRVNCPFSRIKTTQRLPP